MCAITEWKKSSDYLSLCQANIFSSETTMLRVIEQHQCKITLILQISTSRYHYFSTMSTVLLTDFHPLNHTVLWFQKKNFLEFYFLLRKDILNHGSKGYILNHAKDQELSNTIEVHGRRRRWGKKAEKHMDWIDSQFCGQFAASQGNFSSLTDALLLKNSIKASHKVHKLSHHLHLACT